MAATPSTMVELGTMMPNFTLSDSVSGHIISSDSVKGAEGTLVAFICNHCPYVKHIRSALAELGRHCETSGIGMVAISANDAETYPDDSPENMKLEAEQAGYSFPYLHDADQSVAKRFDAACTPDFFLFDRAGKLAYRGQFDASRPGNGIPVTGKDLWAAVDALISGEAPNPQQTPSVGCNIKWKPGNQPSAS